MNVKACARRLTAACLGLLAIAAAAQAQQYPNRPATIISDSAAGSTPDAVLRVIADQLGQIWGQQVLAVNHPGATGSIATRIAADAAPDGYTLYMPVLSSFVSLPGLASNVPIQLPRDFTPIGFAGENPMFVVVNPSLGISKLSDLIAKAKAHPGKISCAVTGVGRLTHLTAELLQSRSGIELLTVPYTGGPAQAIGDVVSGRVAFIIEGYSGIAGAVQSGSVKAIAVASEKRLREFPDVPTVAETLPGFSATGWQVLVAPRGTSESIIQKVSNDLRRVVTDRDLQQKIATRGSYTRAMSPAEVLAFVAGEQRKWKPVMELIAKKTQ
ncbi:MAG TPA: tripartite tricarboxylate transporter substrate-binding protein [Methyloceanibacter sp.]|nr:tripartite tricarboxylate transporter substrate-binding protein [Methyloceanibacter sp.]